VKVVWTRGVLAIPGDIELDAADWLNIMILRIGLSVNLPRTKVCYVPAEPANGMDWHATTDQS
jgi:hypothetical protein